MKQINMILTFLSLLGYALASQFAKTQTDSIASKRELSNPGLDTRTVDLPHPLGVMTFVGNIGGHEIEFNGTAQEAVAHVQSLDPNFNVNATFSTSELNSRAALNKVQPPLCCPVRGQNWKGAYTNTISDGITYLYGVQGTCGVGATSCVRISCSFNSAIYLCNDNHYAIQPNCGYLASYAQDLLNDCSFWTKRREYHDVCGQEFDTDNYNIIVRADTC